MRLWKLALALGCVVGCGRPVTEPARTVVTSPEAAAGHEECPRALTLERGAISDEVVCLLQQYVRIDTTNPPGNELETARFLRDVLARDGISAAAHRVRARARQPDRAPARPTPPAGA